MRIATKNLLAELTWANKFTERKTSIPILTHVLFEAADGRIKLTGTDLETAGLTMVEGQGTDTWTVAVPVDKLIKYLQKVEEPDVILSASDTHKLLVAHGKDGSMTAGMSRESYPEPPAIPAAQATLRNLPWAVDRTAFCIAKEESRFTLDGALVEIGPDGSQMVSTDGHRLSAAPLDVRTKETLRAVVRAFALTEAAKIEGDWTIALDDAHVFLGCGRRHIITRKLENNFPDYKRVMFSEAYGHALIPVKSTLKTLERVRLFADERSQTVTFGTEDNTLTLQAETAENGAASGAIPFQQGEVPVPYRCGFNAKYIAEFLAKADVEHVAMCWQERDKNGNYSSAAMLVTGDWKYTVMPMRIG